MMIIQSLKLTRYIVAPSQVTKYLGFGCMAKCANPPRKKKKNGSKLKTLRISTKENLELHKLISETT